MRAFQRRHLPGLCQDFQDSIVIEHDGNYYVLEADNLRPLPWQLVRDWERNLNEMDTGKHHTWIPL